VAEDVPLFDAIISDLFPGIELRQPDYSKLIDAFKQACTNKNLESIEEFEAKAIQLN